MITGYSGLYLEQITLLSLLLGLLLCVILTALSVSLEGKGGGGGNECISVECWTEILTQRRISLTNE